MDNIQSTTRLRRTQQLDPDLIANKVSQGWAFSIPNSFCSALDIHFTDIVQDKVKTKAWTQGFNYDFQTGDTLYDKIEGRELPWLQALQVITTCLKVESARKAEPANFTEGEVVFAVLHPSEDRTKLERGSTYSGTQNEFVTLLKTGSWQGIHHSSL